MTTQRSKEVKNSLDFEVGNGMKVDFFITVDINSYHLSSSFKRVLFVDACFVMQNRKASMGLFQAFVKLHNKAFYTVSVACFDQSCLLQSYTDSPM